MGEVDTESSFFVAGVAVLNEKSSSNSSSDDDPLSLIVINSLLADSAFHFFRMFGIHAKYVDTK
jgi:hypothetical protein